MKTEKQSLTEALARYWSSARYEDLPPEVVAMAKSVLLDTLSVGVRGGESEAAVAVRTGVAKLLECTSGSATLWGTRLSLPPGAAALVNGTAAHSFELDDYGGCGHSGAVVVPAVCAAAERQRSDGRRVLLAIAAGYDLAARVTEGSGGYRAHNDTGFHSTGTCGTFGAAAGAASILGLDAQKFTSALGIAGSYAGGTWAFLADGAMTKRFHPGRASENGVSAAFLAESGLVGPHYILESTWGGFYRTYTGAAAKPEATAAGLGREFRIMQTGQKPHAACRGLHSSVEALLDVMHEQKVAGEDIERMIVHGADRTVRQFAKRDVQTLLDAQFSMAYALGVVAATGRSGLDEFSPPRTGDAQVQMLMDRVEIVADRALGPYDEPELEVRGRNGAVWWRHVPVPRGAPERPLELEQLLRKDEGVAVPAIGQRQFDALKDAVLDLETCSDFGEVAKLLRPV
ncbi:MAG TPA: MmgE/PrpD family protein [Burkholderiales bacterium]|nr:MmgE/PrpD family protein [Burkholderiales bacterium]